MVKALRPDGKAEERCWMDCVGLCKESVGEYGLRGSRGYR